jgi:hypothetical protein
MGQFEKVYYNPYKVIEVLSNYGVTGAYVSSTTSCIVWDDINEKKIVLDHIKAEFDELLYCAEQYGIDARPLCWVIPQRYFEGDSITQMYSEIEYMGFKIHPGAHKWNLQDNRIESLLDDICHMAIEKRVPIFIHTGVCDYELPQKFEEWFAKYPNAIFVLAHCRKPMEAIRLFDKYKNLYGDVSYTDIAHIKVVFEHGYAQRMLYGSDFPITNYRWGMESYADSDLYKNYGTVITEWDDMITKFGNMML